MLTDTIGHRFVSFKRIELNGRFRKSFRSRLARRITEQEHQSNKSG